MRPEKVKQKARELIDEGQKPSAILLAQQLEFAPSDVHRCLNILERRGEVETYTKEALGAKHRLVGVNRT